jgi:hypothetical protein
MEKLNEGAVVVIPAEHTKQVTVERRGFFDATPKEQVAQATEIANVLSSVIEKQGLFSNIGGKKYIKAEGWQTLGTFLGVVPREKSVTALPDGSYEAYVEIVKFRDGTVVGGGSAICSRKEKRWSGADAYAVRSMAITRATGKAFRVGFSWIVTLAGYQPTNEEEMPPKEDEPVKTKVQKLYTGADNEKDAVIGVLQKQSVPTELWDEVHKRLMGRPSKDLPAIIQELQQ